MEAVLQNSTISSTNLSHTSNPSTARLLIDHIKRLVEDDMKLTVEAFKIIENEIIFDHRNESLRRKNSSNRSSTRSQHSISPNTQQLEFPFQNDRQNYQERFTHTSRGSINSSDFLTDNTNQMQKKNSLEKSPATSTPIRNKSSGSGKQFQNSQTARLSFSQGCESFSQNCTDLEDVPVTSSTPGGSSFNVSSIQRTKSEDSKFSKKFSLQNRRMSISPNVQSFANVNLRNGQSSDKLPNTNSNNTSNMDVTTDDNIDEEFISLTRVASMFHSRFTEEIKKVMDRIHERFESESLSRIENAKKPGLQTITRRVYDDFSPVWIYGNTASSVDTPQQSSYTIKDRKIRLPQLLAFSNNSKLQGSDLTIDSESIARLDSKYKRNVEPSESDDKAQLSDDGTGRTDIRSDENIDYGIENTNENVELADIINKVAVTAAKISDGEMDATDNGTEHIDENVEGPNETTDEKTQKSIISADGVNKTTTDDPKVSEPEPSKTTDIVTITDIGSETTFTKSPNNAPKATENELPRDEELTDTFSSSLVATPKTAERQTSREWTHLDEIASLINQASPSRRIVIKKKLPDVSVKGYSKICNEKIIFSGNKITHVKTDRKTMCRDFNPKNDTEN